MDKQTKEKITSIIKKEIQLEDDMLELYSTFLGKLDIFKKMSEGDRSIATEILNMLLRDTKKHKIMMQEIINNL